MSDEHEVSHLDLLVVFLILAAALFTIGWSHQSQLYDLQHRIAILEQERR